MAGLRFLPLSVGRTCLRPAAMAGSSRAVSRQNFLRIRGWDPREFVRSEKFFGCGLRLTASAVTVRSPPRPGQNNAPIGRHSPQTACGRNLIPPQAGGGREGWPRTGGLGYGPVVTRSHQRSWSRWHPSSARCGRACPLGCGAVGPGRATGLYRAAQCAGRRVGRSEPAASRAGPMVCRGGVRGVIVGQDGATPLGGWVRVAEAPPYPGG